MTKTPRLLTTIFSSYELTEQIGQGGSGRVFRAFDDSGTEVAVKMLDSAAPSRKRRKRFVNEIRFGSRTDHENVVSVIDHGVSDKEASPVAFLVMPLYQGSLRDKMSEGISPADVLSIFSMIIAGVEAAHLQNVVHRDIKPENVLFSQANAREVYAVADFGIARFTEEDLYTSVETSDGERLANFQYAAPEQRVRGRVADKRSDIYSLGLLLNEMFTREIPVGTDFKKIGDVSAAYEFLDAVVDKMIKQNPDDRYGSIVELRREIRVRSERALSEENLHRLRVADVGAGDLDDPIFNDPIRITHVDWTDGWLTLQFQQETNNRWVIAVANMGSHSSVMGSGPRDFVFAGSEARVVVRHGSAQDAINHFKDWLPLIHREYESSLRRDISNAESKRRKEIEDQIRREELNAKTRAELSF